MDARVAMLDPMGKTCSRKREHRTQLIPHFASPATMRWEIASSLKLLAMT